MKNLNYQRIEFDKNGNRKADPKIVTRVHKAPAMPDDVHQIGEGAWQQITRGQNVMVIRTWWLTDAARMVA